LVLLQELCPQVIPVFRRDYTEVAFVRILHCLQKLGINVVSPFFDEFGNNSMLIVVMI